MLVCKSAPGHANAQQSFASIDFCLTILCCIVTLSALVAVKANVKKALRQKLADAKTRREILEAELHASSATLSLAKAESGVSKEKAKAEAKAAQEAAASKLRKIKDTVDETIGCGDLDVIRATIKKIEAHNGWDNPSTGLLQRYRALEEYRDAIVAENERMAEENRRAKLQDADAAAEIAAPQHQRTTTAGSTLQSPVSSEFAHDYVKDSVAALRTAAGSDSKYKTFKTLPLLTVAIDSYKSAAAQLLRAIDPANMKVSDKTKAALAPKLAQVQERLGQLSRNLTVENSRNDSLENSVSYSSQQLPEMRRSQNTIEDTGVVAEGAQESSTHSVSTTERSPPTHENDQDHTEGSALVRSRGVHSPHLDGDDSSESSAAASPQTSEDDDDMPAAVLNVAAADSGAPDTSAVVSSPLSVSVSIADSANTSRDVGVVAEGAQKTPVQPEEEDLRPLQHLGGCLPTPPVPTNELLAQKLGAVSTDGAVPSAMRGSLRRLDLALERNDGLIAQLQGALGVSLSTSLSTFAAPAIVETKTDTAMARLEKALSQNDVIIARLNELFGSEATK
eukprot:SAG31_NODE_44_length_31168_cov_16.507290_23_plen_565_part_00